MQLTLCTTRCLFPGSRGCFHLDGLKGNKNEITSLLSGPQMQHVCHINVCSCSGSEMELVRKETLIISACAQHRAYVIEWDAGPTRLYSYWYRHSSLTCLPPMSSHCLILEMGAALFGGLWAPAPALTGHKTEPGDQCARLSEGHPTWAASKNHIHLVLLINTTCLWGRFLPRGGTDSANISLPAFLTLSSGSADATAEWRVEHNQMSLASSPCPTPLLPSTDCGSLRSHILLCSPGRRRAKFRSSWVRTGLT